MIIAREHTDRVLLNPIAVPAKQKRSMKGKMWFQETFSQPSLAAYLMAMSVTFLETPSPQLEGRYSFQETLILWWKLWQRFLKKHNNICGYRLWKLYPTQRQPPNPLYHSKRKRRKREAFAKESKRSIFNDYKLWNFIIQIIQIMVEALNISDTTSNICEPCLQLVNILHLDTQAWRSM